MLSATKIHRIQMQLFCWIFVSRRSPPLKTEDYTSQLLESGSLEYLGFQPLGFVESLESLVEDQSSAGKSVVGCTTRTNKSLRSWKSVAVGRSAAISLSIKKVSLVAVSCWRYNCWRNKITALVGFNG